MSTRVRLGALLIGLRAPLLGLGYLLVDLFALFLLFLRAQLLSILLRQPMHRNPIHPEDVILHRLGLLHAALPIRLFVRLHRTVHVVLLDRLRRPLIHHHRVHQRRNIR